MFNDEIDIDVDYYEDFDDEDVEDRDNFSFYDYYDFIANNDPGVYKGIQPSMISHHNYHSISVNQHHSYYRNQPNQR